MDLYERTYKSIDSTIQKYGTTAVITSGTAQQKVNCIFRPLSEDERQIRGIESEEIVCIVSAKSTQTQPLTGDRMRRSNDATWAVLEVETIKPADKTLLYKLVLGK